MTINIPATRALIADYIESLSDRHGAAGQVASVYHGVISLDGPFGDEAVAWARRNGLLVERATA